MPTRKPVRKSENKLEVGTLKLTDIDALPTKAVREKGPLSTYTYCYTTGPFSLPQNSGSLDWILLNNDKTTQKSRVTIFKCSLAAPKTPVPPGPLVVTLGPGETTHNANTYTEGFVYEVRVECNSHLIFPYVSVWPSNFGVAIPGTGINSGLFIRLMQ